ncbi:MAG TPA: ornithine--oxo-acid transaminase [Anaerolineae bacterium]|nr:ornithine--oxo-acid transaminase [Anaerolineae bacterium]
MRSIEYIELADKYGAHNYKPLDVILTKGEGVWVYDVDGKKYLDCLSSYSALNQGHVHPKILAALIEQAKKLTLTSRAFRNDQLPLLYKELADLSGYEMSILMNSGSEAVETSLKIARKWAYCVKNIPLDKAEIIVADGNFHGRTITIISFSSERLYKEYFGPLTPGFISVPYGNADAIRRAIHKNTAGILIEPIQGEGGVIIPPKGYLQEIRKICDEHNILFIADEIQTGLGRTGKLFACDHEGVRPDVMILGKALSGGFYPVSAVLSEKSVLGLFIPGEHGSTFGGNPLGVAVTRAALRVISEENLIENTAAQGMYLEENLAEIPGNYIKEVRGKGLLIGVEMKPEAGEARKYCEVLKDRGILAKETHETTIRFAPPLIIDKQTIDWALPIIREVLSTKP